MSRFILICLATVIIASVAISTTPDGVLEDLFDGEVELANQVKLKGDLYYQSDDGNQRGYAFYGYKYGQSRRFEDSVPNTDVSYMNDRNHPKMGYACPQLPNQFAGLNVFQRNLSMQEDCLYLDVYLPAMRKLHQKSWPVLFWVFGGGFVIGDKDLYNGSILAQSVDAIVVTINYRLSAMGFLSTGDSAARGNWAIGDIKLALNWTFENIASFHGDPGRITIFGESAGATLVSAVMLDNQIRDKVFAAVCMSGSILNRNKALRKDPETVATAIARRLNCSTKNSSAIVDCLRKESVARLLQASMDAQQDAGAYRALLPVIDGKHIRKEPLEILQDRTRQPTPATGRTASSAAVSFITGYLKQDHAFFLLDRPEIFNAPITWTILNDLLVPLLTVVTSDCSTNSQLQMQLILQHYGLTVANSSEELYQGHLQISTDMLYALRAVTESDLYNNASAGSSQMYRISYDPGYKKLGAFHFMDVIHLFRGYLDIKLMEKTSQNVTDTLHDFFRQIAHDGSFSPSPGHNGSFFELNQQAKWIEKPRDFAQLQAFWATIKNLPCPDTPAIAAKQ